VALTEVTGAISLHSTRKGDTGGPAAPRDAPCARAQLRGNERLRKESDLLAAYLRRTDHRSLQAETASSPKARHCRNQSRQLHAWSVVCVVRWSGAVTPHQPTS